MLVKFKYILLLLLLITIGFMVYQYKFPKQADNVSVIINKVNQGPLLKADKVLVNKKNRRLYLMNNNKIFREYHIALGQSPTGHKKQEGDEKTPEGEYTLDWRNAKSIAYKSLHISYPNKADKLQAKNRKVSAGGNIMIHGILNRYAGKGEWLQRRDWTDGCIAVLDKDMEEIWQSVKIGTKITILP